MESLLYPQHGVSALIAGLIVMIGLHLFVKLLEMGLQIFQKKSETTDQTKVDVIRLDYQMKTVQDKLDEVLRLKKDVNKVFSAIRFLAGDKWHEVKKEMEDRPQ